MPFQFSDGGAHGWKIYPTDDVTALKDKKVNLHGKAY